MQHLFLLTRFAQTEIAINSECIESVVAIGDVVQVPQCDPVVAGLFALRSRVLTLVDCQYRISNVRQTPEKGSLAVVAEIGGHHFGLLVEKVSDVVPVDPTAILPAIKLDPAWSAIVDHVIEVGDRMIMVLDPSALVMPQLKAAA